MTENTFEPTTAPASERTHYQLLEIDPAASDDVIEAVYERLREKAEAAGDGSRVEALAKAYYTLGDPRRRATYDAEQHLHTQRDYATVEVSKGEMHETVPQASSAAGTPLTEVAALPVSDGSDGAASSMEVSEVADEIETLYCANHPDRETLLRCNRCGKPICMKCAKLTDVGYRCPECIRGVQDNYFNAETRDNPIAFGTALLVAAIATPIVGALLGQLFIFGIIIAIVAGPSAGGIVAQIVRSAVGKRRGRRLRYFAVAGITLGTVLGGVIALLFGIWAFNLGMLIFVVSAALTVNQLLR